MYVPGDLNWNPIDFDFLISPKFPLQFFDLEDSVFIDGKTELSVFVDSAIDANLPDFAPNFRLRGVNSVSEHVLLSGD